MKDLQLARKQCAQALKVILRLQQKNKIYLAQNMTQVQ